MAVVRLVDLELIKRYSLAVRRDTVDAEELLAALDASRATVEAAIDRDASGTTKGRRRPAAAPGTAGAARATRARQTGKTPGVATPAARRTTPRPAPPAPGSRARTRRSSGG
jgi:hypothetical protein